MDMGVMNQAPVGSALSDGCRPGRRKSRSRVDVMVGLMELAGDEMDRAYNQELCDVATPETRQIISLRARILRLELDRLERRLGPPIQDFL